MQGVLLGRDSSDHIGSLSRSEPCKSKTKKAMLLVPGTSLVMRLSPDPIQLHGVIGFDIQTSGGFTLIHDHAVNGPLWRGCVGVPVVWS